eukprot:m.21718 g.21718  ORF g.21718 m.21718 type:complete len:108 (-) comp8748_c0_seq6:1180-1503(-)
MSKGLNQEELNEVVNQSVNTALKGGAIGLTVGAVAAVGLNRVWPWYRRLTPALKSFSVMIPLISGMMIWGEEELIDIGAQKNKVLHDETYAKRMEEFKRLDAESKKE